MLVLSRKVGERIQFGDDIVLTVTATKGNRVQLGISVPKDVAIRRGELLEFALPDAASTTCGDQETAKTMQVA